MQASTLISDNSIDTAHRYQGHHRMRVSSNQVEVAHGVHADDNGECQKFGKDSK
jgi:hypothetical protein